MPPQPPPSHASSALADWARSGVAALTGHPDGAPLIPPGSAATHAGQLADLITAASAGRVRVDGARLLAERAAFTGHVRRGPVSPGGHCRLLPTADGWAAVTCARPDDPHLLGALVGAELPADPWPAIAAWLRANPGDALAERATLLGVAAAPVRVPAVTPPLGLSGLPPRPVEGLLVVDFSALWAGPLCAHLLGLAGARVVKVETSQRPDGARAGNPDFYRLLHAGHRCVVADPATPGGRAVLAALVDAADIVIEASRPRALARWGLDAHAAAAAGTTWISITAAGRASDRIGFGDDIAASAGLIADDGGQPVFCGDAFADPLAGLTAAAAAMSVPSDGPGALWDIAMDQVVAATLDPGLPGSAARPDGGGWVVDTPQGPVPVATPQRRELSGDAAEPGTDTAVVLRELGITSP